MFQIVKLQCTWGQPESDGCGENRFVNLSHMDQVVIVKEMLLDETHLMDLSGWLKFT